MGRGRDDLDFQLPLPPACVPPTVRTVLSAEQAMGFRVAKSLLALRDQVDASAPHRDKSSDGTIGDNSHQTRKSDHNPNANGVVTAMDISNDPAHGVVARDIAEMLRISEDPRIKYVISNRQIYSSQVSPWQWRPYTGANAHVKHVHVSVVDVPALYDDVKPWSLDVLARTSVPPAASAISQFHFSNIVATVFGGHADPNTSAYDGHLIDDHEIGVALPSRFFGSRPKVRVTNPATRRTVECGIVDLGPWNTHDPYWETNARPQAESGTDMSGRKTNLAGIDLTPGAAVALGIAGKGKVDWEFVTSAAVGPQASAALANPQQMTLLVTLLQALAKNGGVKMPIPAEVIRALLQQILKVPPVTPVTPTPVSTPTSLPVSEADDATRKIIDLITGLIDPAVSGKPPLGQVNGALGQGIGNALDGKKTAIGIFGSLLSTILPALTAAPTAALPGGGLLAVILPTALGASLPGVGLPVFLAMTVWGLLGKMEKWNQGNVPLSK